MNDSTAVEYLLKIFSQSDSDTLTIAEAYKTGRPNVHDYKKNRAWLGNIMTYAKKYELAIPVYKRRGNVDYLDKIALTDRGKRVLGRGSTLKNNSKVPQIERVENNLNDINVNRVIEMASALARDNKERKVEVDINIKGGEIVTIRLS